jgi:thiamine biosynthesis lipoprotein
VPVRAEALMGTMVTIEAVGAHDGAAIERAFDWFRTVEHICTRFDPASELCQLASRSGKAVPVSRLLFEAVQFALHIADASGGAFDPTVGTAMHRRGFNREHRSGVQVPLVVDSIDEVSYRDVSVDSANRTITLQRPLLLDLGAVAKGLAIDLAARELESCGSFAIDAGGDLYLGGVNHEGQPWTIGIRHPRRPGECITSVRVTNQAVCTSGDYERMAGPAEVGHHIIDPRTGSSPSDVASVTVIAPSAMAADALATAAFVLGRDAGVALLREMGVEGLFVTTNLDLIPTPGWLSVAH